MADARYGDLVMAGRMEKDGRNPLVERGRWGNFAIVYLLEGSGWFESAPTGGRAVEAGDAFLLRPEVSHRYGPRPGERWRELYLVFAGAAFEAIFRSGAFPAERAVLSLPGAAWRRRLEAFLAPAPQPLAERLATACRLQLLLLDMASAVEPVSAPDWLDQALARMQRRPVLGLRMERLAAELGLPYETFRRRFRALVGESPAKHHASLVMQRACALLYAGELRMKEIAGELGFCDEYHFSRRFRQWAGCAPSRYARQATPRADG